MQTAERNPIFPIDPLHGETPDLDDMDIEVEAIRQLADNRWHMLLRDITALKTDLHYPEDEAHDLAMHARLRRLKALASLYYAIRKPLDLEVR